MPFVKQPSQSPTIAALAGRAVGNAQRSQMMYESQQKEREDQRQFEQQLAVHRIQQSDQMAAELRRLDADKELATFRERMDVEGQKRAMAWEVQKATLRSKLEFEADEKREIKKQQEYEAGLDVIDKHPMRSDKKDEARFLLAMGRYGGVDASSIIEDGQSVASWVQDQRSILGLGPGTPIDEVVREAKRSGVSLTPPAGAEQYFGQTQPTAPAAPDRLLVKAPDGTVGTISATAWEEAKRAGYTLVQ